MAFRFPSSTWQKIKGQAGRMLLIRRASFGATMHLYFFNERTFAKMARVVGLEILRIKTTAAEANTNNAFLDFVKIASSTVLGAVETISGRRLGNLEVYCRKVPS